MASQDQKHQDLILRGDKRSNPAGTLIFVGLRAADPFLQYKLLAGGWGAAILSKLGVAAISPSGTASSGIALADRLGLPLPHLIVLVMAAGSTVKQIYWLTALSFENFPPATAVMVSVFNTLINTVNSLLLLSAATSSVSASKFPGTDLPYPVALAPVAYALGIALETVSEWQRRKFKDDPRGQGKVMRSGLWTLARHINYGGYMVWRGAYTLASSGVIGGSLVAAYFGWNFASRGVPALDAYCAKRYGEQWVAFKRDVQWVLLPGIY